LLKTVVAQARADVLRGELVRNRYSTASKPSRAAAAKRSRNACSWYIIERLAANFGMASPSRAERAAQLVDLRFAERLDRTAGEHGQARGLLELLEHAIAAPGVSCHTFGPRRASMTGADRRAGVAVAANRLATRSATAGRPGAVVRNDGTCPTSSRSTA
jgi:D-alanine-D-alanine ligase-like ATP-grasp enzyme